MSWTGGIAILFGVALVGVSMHTMSVNPDKDSVDYQLGVGGIFVALLCVLFGILMLKTGLGTRLFTTGHGPGMGMGGGGMGMGGGMMGGGMMGGGGGYW